MLTGLGRGEGTWGALTTRGGVTRLGMWGTRKSRERAGS
jgi:hypothetical protein